MAEIINNNPIYIAIFAGIIPTLVWLFFWLREDRFQPEPTGLLFLTFIAGSLSVFIILPLESIIKNLGVIGTEKIFIFAAIEEIVKFGVVFLIDFHSSYLDEPIDYAVYLITGSLGFAMMENIMFLTNPQLYGDISFIVQTGIFRFLGATIVHSILAATLGVILGFVFYKRKKTKRLFLFIGLLIVTILHTIFNYFIIDNVHVNMFLTLGSLWLLTLIIISLFERVRRVDH